MRKRRSRRKVAYRKNLQNRFSMILVSLVVIVLLVVVGVRSYGLTLKREELQRQKDEVIALQEKEEQRAKEIEQYAKYVKTKEFIEYYARKNLNLVKEDEVIFKKEE